MGIVFTAFLIGAIVAGPTMDALVGVAALAVALIATYWVCAGRPRVISTGSQVVIVNPLRTVCRELGDIIEVQGAWSGLWIHARDQRPVAAWAVQKANVSKMTGRRTRADEIADQISAAALAFSRR